MRRPAPKDRRPSCPCATGKRPARAKSKQSEKPLYGAPGHLGGQFEDAGYSSGGGQFGFRHDTTS